MQAYYWVTKTAKVEDGPKPAVFPERAARYALANPDLLPNIRDLRGITRTPTIRRDGTVLQTPGYDNGTRLLYVPAIGLTVPTVADEPSSKDTEKARKLIDYMLCDFILKSEHDTANYLGLMLTPLLRELPPYKLGIIQAHQKGSGKGFLAGAIRTIHGGQMKPAALNDEEETRKAITSVLTTTDEPVITWDNVVGAIRSGHLAALLTGPIWTDRPLGRTANVSARNDRLWTCTGNNVKLGGDLERRGLWSRSTRS